MSLLIVESPAKCKKIEEYLPEYKCIASYGHFREIRDIKDINMETFEINYSVIKGKEKTVENMRKHIDKACDIIIATDDDREGEGIAWHICDHFGLSLKTTKRIVFHEITQQALVTAVNNPTTVNMNVVKSQKCRQIIDMLVGFFISPVLWKYLPSVKGLSAGRCQTPALRLIKENQDDINSSTSSTEYVVTAYHNKIVPFVCNKTFASYEDVKQFLLDSKDCRYQMRRTKPKNASKAPPEPLNTSRIQQIANNLLHLSPKDTMNICQKLYEKGYITYMRTDSNSYSDEFIESANNYILKTHGSLYVSPRPICSKRDESAHEAIRPTNVTLPSAGLDGTALEKKVYGMIRDITLQSLMAPSQSYSYECVFYKLDSDKQQQVEYSHTFEMCHFLGWEIIKYNKETHKENERLYNQYSSPVICPELSLIRAKMHMTNHKLHYTESRLVNLIEEKGIGRPSTFSWIVEKIKDREYVKREDIDGKQMDCVEYELLDGVLAEKKSRTTFHSEKNKLVIQPLGEVVVDYLVKCFPKIFDYTYTRNMEAQLDKVALGKLNYFTVCKEYYETIKQEINGVCSERFEMRIDDEHTYVIGKNGPVIKSTSSDHVTFKPVKKGTTIAGIVDIVSNYKDGRDDCNTSSISAIDKVLDQNIHSLGRYKDAEIVLMKGKYGTYTNYLGRKISLSKHFGNRPLANITLQEVVDILENDDGNGESSIIRIVNPSVKIMRGKDGKNDYIMLTCATKKSKKPQFISLNKFSGDYRTCSVAELMSYVYSL